MLLFSQALLALINTHMDQALSCTCTGPQLACRPCVALESALSSDDGGQQVFGKLLLLKSGAASTDRSQHRFCMVQNARSADLTSKAPWSSLIIMQQEQGDAQGYHTK